MRQAACRSSAYTWGLAAAQAIDVSRTNQHLRGVTLSMKLRVLGKLCASASAGPGSEATLYRSTLGGPSGESHDGKLHVL
jgi:hypothetical protein